MINKAPERIWAEPGMPGYTDGPCATYTVEYTRSDLHAELVKAADELAEAVADMTFSDNAIAALAALTAYQSTKEKLK